MKMRTSARPGAFDPEAIAAMSEAFEGACEVLRDAGPPEVVRETVTGRIIVNLIRLFEGAWALPEQD
jgi:hypothetical protein